MKSLLRYAAFFALFALNTHADDVIGVFTNQVVIPTNAVAAPDTPNAPGGFPGGGSQSGSLQSSGMESIMIETLAGSGISSQFSSNYEPEITVVQAFDALSGGVTSENPPDTFGAVGPSHIVTMLNSEVLIQSRTGATLEGPVSLDTWWPTAAAQHDPRVYYDRYSGHWYAVAAGGSEMNLAISENEDPTGTWHFRTCSTQNLEGVPTDYHIADFPQIGYSSTLLAISVNLMKPTATGYELWGAAMFLFDKDPLLADPEHAVYSVRPVAATQFPYPCPTIPWTETAPLHLLTRISPNAPAGTTWEGQGIICSVPVDSVDDPELFAQERRKYYLSVEPWSAAGLHLPQRDSEVGIYSWSDMIVSAGALDTAIYCAHSIFLPAEAPTRSAVQIWRLTPPREGYAGSARRIIIGDATGERSYAYPSIARNDAGDLAIGCATISATLAYPSAELFFLPYYAWSSTPEPSVYDIGAIGTDVFHFRVGELNRWGDYSATVVDPVNGIDFWTCQEYAIDRDLNQPINLQGRWRTRWAQLGDLRPGNDNFPDAEVISGPAGSTTGRLYRSTAEPGEPQHWRGEWDWWTLPGTYSAKPQTVWYRLVAPATGSLALGATVNEVTAVGAAIGMAIYRGGSLNALTYSGAYQYAGFKVNGGPELANCFPDANGPVGAWEECSTTQGEVYAIAVFLMGSSENYPSCGIDLYWEYIACPPVVLIGPGNAQALVGQAVTFEPSVYAQPLASYQWKKDGIPIPGATTKAYTIASVQTSDAGDYVLEALNFYGLVASAAAHLSVFPSVTAALGTPVPNGGQFVVTVNGTSGALYQIEASSDLVTWSYYDEKTCVNGMFSFQFSSESAMKFFRVTFNP